MAERNSTAGPSDAAEDPQAELRVARALVRIGCAALHATDLEGWLHDALVPLGELSGCRALMAFACDPLPELWRIVADSAGEGPAGSVGVIFGLQPADLQRLRDRPGTPTVLGAAAAEGWPPALHGDGGAGCRLALEAAPRSGAPWLLLGTRAAPADWTGQELDFFHQAAGLIASGLNQQLDQQALRNGERHFRTLADNLPEFIVRFDAAGRRTYRNPALLGLQSSLGVDVGASTDARVRVTLDAQDRERFDAALARALRGQPKEQIECRLVDGAGERRIHSVLFVPERDAEGRVVGVLTTGRDVTEERRTFEELQLHRDRLEELVALRTQQLQAARDEALAATRAKSQFLAHMSHEIRTPMNAVIGMTHLALQSGLEPRQRNYVSKAHLAAQSLLGIVNDILDFSKIEAGRMTLESTEFEPIEIVDRVAGMVGMPAEDKRLELLIDVDPALPPVLVGDPLRLGQVLLNLAGNAVKFTERGEVVISLRMLGIDAGRCHLRFEVRDSGPGIEFAVQQQLFQPFAQADASTSRLHGGTGLGLAISRRLVELMGGRLDLQSAPGQGSSFQFELWLPLGPSRATPAATTTALSGSRLLVVDDHAGARKVSVTLASRIGLRADAAADGLAALEAIRREEAGGDPYKLLLIDWRMPELDGIECLARLDAQDLRQPPLAVMMTSPYGLEAMNRELARRELTVHAILSKPITPSSLLDACSRALGRPSAETRAEAGVAEANVPPGPLAGARVLLVEDNEVNQEIAREVLGRAGIDVKVVGTGWDALAALEQASYDAVLMDCQLPGLDGYETTRRIRRDARWRGLPVIAMTASALDDERESMLDAGMDDYIAKPVDVDRLFAVLRRWIAAPGRPGADVTMPAPLEGPSGFDATSAMRRLGGDRGLYLRLARRFADTHADFVTTFRRALADGDDRLAHRMAHDLTGSAGLVGAFELAASARQLESASQQGVHDPGVGSALRQVEGRLATALERLRSIVGETA